MSRVLHLSAHLGGGVGRALESLVQAERGTGREHAIVCLEAPHKTASLAAIRAAGASVIVAPDAQALHALIATADLVQLEFWNHPATLRALCAAPLPPMRLVTWCHVSGLHFPRIDPRLVGLSSRFLLTSGCTWQAPEFAALSPSMRERIVVVSSAAGLERLPAPPADRGSGARCRFGYLGSLNFAKLHPRIVDWLCRVEDPSFHLRLIGDELNRSVLSADCAARGRPGLLEFAGYRSDVVAELSALDVMVYLLNPCHYGTAEIALLEAMAMGVVPVVLPNPAELAIVEHGRTGIVVNNGPELVQALERLARDPDWRCDLAEQASQAVRSRHTLAALAAALEPVYRAALDEPRRVLDFGAVLGRGPAEWFRGFVRDETIYRPDGDLVLPQGLARHAHLEHSKGSVRHFHQYFPADASLAGWAAALQAGAELTCH